LRGTEAVNVPPNRVDLPDSMTGRPIDQFPARPGPLLAPLSKGRRSLAHGRAVAQAHVAVQLVQQDGAPHHLGVRLRGAPEDS
jgi:hypothetical protein